MNARPPQPSYRVIAANASVKRTWVTPNVKWAVTHQREAREAIRLWEIPEGFRQTSVISGGSPRRERGCGDPCLSFVGIDLGVRERVRYERALAAVAGAIPSRHDRR